jgi:hypothetical protein
MYHLLIERVSIVTIEFLQYRARVRIGLNRAGIERAVERIGLFTSLAGCSDVHNTATTGNTPNQPTKEKSTKNSFQPLEIAVNHSSTAGRRPTRKSAPLLAGNLV